MSNIVDPAVKEEEDERLTVDNMQDIVQQDGALRQETPSPGNEADNENENNNTEMAEMENAERRSSTLTSPEIQIEDGLAADDADVESEGEKEPIVMSEVNEESGAAGSTPWPREVTGTEEDTVDKKNTADARPQDEPENVGNPQPEDFQETQQYEAFPGNTRNSSRNELMPEQTNPVTPTFETFGGAAGATGTSYRKPLPLSLDRMAIENCARNKLAISEVKGKVVHLGRHTQSSSQKVKHWYKGENYVDKDSYSWRNMALFDDFQRHMYTAQGSLRTSCKK